MSLRRLVSKYAILIAFPSLLAIACDDQLRADHDGDTGDAVDGSSGFGSVQSPLISGASHGASAVAVDPDRAPSRHEPVVAHFAARPASVASAQVEAPAPTPLSREAITTLLTRSELAFTNALSSTRATLATELGLTPSSLWLVHDGALVLEHSDEDTLASGSGPAASMDVDGDTFGATRDVDLASTSLAHRLVLGQTVRVFDAHREVCVATVTSLSLEAHLTHTPDMEWDDDGELLPSKPVIYSADEVFESGVTMLKAHLVPLFGDCTEGLWANPVEGHSPTLYREASRPNRASRTRAIAAFRTTSVYQALQARFLDHLGAPIVPAVRWDTFDGQTPEVHRFVGDDGDELYVVSSNTWIGCGSPGQSGLVVLRPRGQGFEFVTGAASDSVPTAFVDLDKDGHPEALYTGSNAKRIERWAVSPDRPLLADDYDTSESLEHLYVPDLSYYGCGC